MKAAAICPRSRAGVESDLLCRAGIWGSLKVEEAQILRHRHPRTHSKKKTLLRGLWGMAGDCGKKHSSRSTPSGTDTLAHQRPGRGQVCLLPGGNPIYFILCCSAHAICVLIHPVVSSSSWPHGPWPARLLCPWDSPGKNTGVGPHALLRGPFQSRDQTCVSAALLAGSLPLAPPVKIRDVWLWTKSLRDTQSRKWKQRSTDKINSRTRS